MRAILGAVSLLVVLGVVGLVASRQLKAVAPVASSPRPSAAQVQQQVTQDLGKALEAGAANRREAEEK